MLASLCPDMHGSIRAGATPPRGSDDLVGHVHGAVDVLDVVELLKTVDEALNLLASAPETSVGVVGTMVVSEPLTWTPCSSSAWRQP